MKCKTLKLCTFKNAVKKIISRIDAIKLFQYKCTYLNSMILDQFCLLKYHNYSHVWYRPVVGICHFQNKVT